MSKSTFDAIQAKLAETLAKNELMHTWRTTQYPITLTVFRDKSPDAQLALYSTGDESVSSSDAKLVFEFTMTGIGIRTDGRLVISDDLMNKVKSMAKKMHYAWLQKYFCEMQKAVGNMAPAPSSDNESDDDTADFDEFFDEYDDVDDADADEK